MKRCPRSFLFLALAGIFLSSFLAPEASSQPRRGMQQIADTLIVRLNLSDEQAAKVKEIVAASQEQMRLDREAFADDRETMMLAMKERMDKMYEDIEAILTVDQKAAFAILKQDMRNRRPGGGPGGPGGGPGGGAPPGGDGNR